MKKIFREHVRNKDVFGLLVIKRLKKVQKGCDITKV